MAHETNDIRSAESNFEPLLMIATPELYRDNAFRVLGLPTTVTVREIERHRKKLKMIAKLGMDSHEQRYGYLPLIPSPDEESIQHAIERLRDPEKRLVDEFFWFWPTKTDSAHDEVLDLLSANRVNEALDILKRSKEHDASGRTAHNLAVLYHAHALDIEYKSKAGPLTKEELETCSRCWKGTYKEWQEILENETFWSQVTARIRELRDPRLTTGIARRIRHSLPKAVFQINTHLARCAAEKNDEATCNYHIKLVNEFGFDEEVFKTVLREEVVSIRQRIRIICKSLKTNTCKNHEHADIRIWEFLLEAKSLLKTIDQLLPEDDIVRDNAHDEVANTGTECTIDYVNKTEDWKETVKLLSQVYDLAAGISLRTRIKKNLDVVNYHAEQEQESIAFKLVETEKKKSISYTTKSIRMKCSLSREEAEGDPESADKVIWQLLLETKPLLQNLKELISDDGLTLDNVKDEITDTAILCQIAYGNRTKNWQQCIVLLMAVYELATSESLRSRIKESISRLNESLRQEQEYEDIKQVKAENHAFVVCVSGANATIPSVCSCCLDVAETTYKVSNSWGEGQDRKTRCFSFPSCRACRQHQKELRWKRATFVLVVIMLPVAVSYLIGFNSSEFSYLEFMAIGGSISVVVFSTLAGLLRTKKLSEKHASRGHAVLLEEVGAGYSTLKFWNPSYAHAFAQANSSKVRTTKVSKHSRDISFIRGGAFFERTAWILGLILIGHSAVYGLLYASQWQTTPPRSRPAARVASSRTYSDNKQQNRSVFDTGPRKRISVTVRSDSSLLAEINQGKSKLKVMEAGLQPTQSLLEKYSKRITSLKTEIEQYESDAARGRYVNRSSYDEAVTNHNKLIEQYNSVLKQHQIKYAAYEAEFKRINDLIDRYNR